MLGALRWSKRSKWQAFDPVRASALILFAAVGAIAFATALSPHGYHQALRLAFALVAGALVSLLLLLALHLLSARLGVRQSGLLAYGMMAAVAAVLLGAAAVRESAPGGGNSPNGRQTQAQQAFHRWSLQAIPLVVRYKDALELDAGHSRGLAHGGAALQLARRARLAERRLRALEAPTARLASSTPSDVRPFMPLLQRAVSLAASAQGKFAAALSRSAKDPSDGGRRRSARVLLRAGNRLLRQSQQAMASFSFKVNGVGGRLYGG
ncbi:MAG TPA: hypothetical protein VJ741_00050 [Solirubrobacteraceae bacterium]|nr:hypothetical protein [Solirubrobacteraceae bacterium]